MIFRNELGQVFDHTIAEVDEQKHAKEYISSNDVVLELGARYGTVSCAINKNLSNPRNQVSVEPDEDVWEALEINRSANGCDFQIFKGVISRIPVSISKEGYATSTLPAEKSNVYTCTLEQLEAACGLRFTVLVADCEGFLEQFFDENPKLYDQLRMVLFEKDQQYRCNYAKIEENLTSHGFIPINTGFQSIWKKPDQPTPRPLLSFLRRS